MRTLWSKKIVISSAVLVLALTGCVETGRTAAPAAGNTKCPWDADDSVKGAVRIAYQKVPNGDPIVKDQGILEACMPNASIKWSVFTSGADVLQAYDFIWRTSIHWQCAVRGGTCCRSVGPCTKATCSTPSRRGFAAGFRCWP